MQAGDMDELEQKKRSTFGRRRVAPRVCIVDAKRYIRAFLADTFEGLGFIPEGCATAAEVAATLAAIPPDLILIVVSGRDDAASDVLAAVAAQTFEGKVLLLGGRNLPGLSELQNAGVLAGLSMLPVLPAPFRNRDLVSRIADLVPSSAPPSMRVDLAEALGNNWLELWYQPKLDVHSLTPRGVEALIRLRHPTWGIVPPACFLPEHGDPHLGALSDFVMEKAMADWMLFSIDYLPIEIAINLPAVVLGDPFFLDRMRRRLPEHPAFNRLVVEISANELTGELAHLHENARRLHAAGIGISIDNVGTEWSSLTGLEGFPVVELKVGPAFVTGCAADRLKRAVCGTLIDTARHLGARAVAIGVETRADLLAVRDMGFDLVQGFLFGKPMEARKFARTLRPEVMPT
jgi:EAL domain-containing protein (putative c-di-GMP-specific phosphodiesterase class I)